MTIQNDWLVYMKETLQHAMKNGIENEIVRIYGKGMRDRLMQGYLKGVEYKKVEIAKKLKSKGIPDNLIEEITGIPDYMIYSL